MSSTITATVTIVRETCCSCGVVFGMPDSLMAARRNDGAWFYCPNGHQQHYTQTEAQRLRKQLEQAERERNSARISRDAARDQLQAAERSRSALRGVITRERRRVANGVCPVDGCHRSFSDLGAHIDTVHPDYETDGARIDTGATETGA